MEADIPLIILVMGLMVTEAAGHGENATTGMLCLTLIRGAYLYNTRPINSLWYWFLMCHHHYYELLQLFLDG